MERTFVMVKPDGVQRGLVGKILQRIEEKGFKIVAMKLTVMPVEKAKEHYAEHVSKKFYQDLVGLYNLRTVGLPCGRGPRRNLCNEEDERRYQSSRSSPWNPARRFRH